MSSLYGNQYGHIPKTHFNFFKVYPNRKKMQQEVENHVDDNGNPVSIRAGNYLLVDYSQENSYTTNQAIDGAEYDHDNFDLTVWYTQEINGDVKSVAVTRLHSILPFFDVQGQYKIDVLEPISAGDYFGKGKL